MWWSHFLLGRFDILTRMEIDMTPIRTIIGEGLVAYMACPCHYIQLDAMEGCNNSMI